MNVEITGPQYAICIAPVGGFNYADSTTYYSGYSGNISTTANQGKVPIPKAGTIQRIDVVMQVSGTLGTNEDTTIALRLNDTTDYNVTTTAQLTAIWQSYSLTGQTIAVVAGDFFELKVVTPAWATNPTVVRLWVTVYIA